MKTLAYNIAFVITLLATLTLHPDAALAQGTAFTYQGQLQDGGSPANGLYDVRTGLYAVNTGGSLVSALYTNLAVPVTNGLFTITMDFGGLFTGKSYWLQIGVRSNGSGASFAPLSPRQELTPAPYAIFAGGANASGLLGTLPAGGLNGIYGGALNLTNTGNSFSGNGAGLSNVAAATLGGLGAAGFWRTNGNAGANPANGAFLGTTDNNPLELHINGVRSGRFEPTANDANHSNLVNVVGGSPVNRVGPGIYGGTIAGGGAPSYFTNVYSNLVTADFGTVGGGAGNVAGGSDNYFSTPSLGFSTVAGGASNFATGSGASIGGGGYGNGIFAGNSASGDASTIGGGIGNTASGGPYGFTTVGGGYFNTASYSYATVGGGFGNTASLNESTVAGGAGNNSTGFASTIGGGYHNIANAEAATAAGGYMNIASNTAATVAGGYQNQAASEGAGYATVGGGYQNNAIGDYTTVAGGSGNAASNNAGGYSTVGGGLNNVASGYGAIIPGGVFNLAGGTESFAAGTFAEAKHDNTFIWSDGEVTPYSSDRANQVKFQAGGGMLIDVSGSSGLKPAAFEVDSTSTTGVAIYATMGSSDATAVFANSGTGNLISGFSGPSAGMLVFKVENDGTVVSKGSVLTSDRNAKENFAELDPEAILARVVAMPVSEWNYKDDPADKKHIGPVAQDFHSAFGLDGRDDTHIAVVDEGGVALAAIQGLDRKLGEKEVEIQSLKQQNDVLRERLGRLETAVQQLGELAAAPR